MSNVGESIQHPVQRPGIALMTQDHQDQCSYQYLAGKAYNTAYGRDNKGAIVVMKYYAGWADKINRKTVERQIIPWNVLKEIFGPVACVMKFNTEDVVEQANDTSYGLAVSVSTEDIDRAIRVAHTLEAGIA
ncbi:hypothetical protein BD769DRAFT_1388653 [Suillus cothurnatus]|nr:hypothetical protein BD769DRAFT_1388653 [Suillus cothurnatus]